MPFRPTSRQLEYLVTLAETGHFGDAARRCAVSQPTLSVQLQQLEQRLGAQLFDRGRGGVHLTPAGEKAAGLARRILAGLDDLELSIAGGEENLGGRIRLGAAPTFGPYFLPRFLPSLHAEYPTLEVFIREEPPRFLEASVIDGSVDCAIGPDPGGDGKFSFQLLLEEELLIGIPADHALADAQALTADALAGERMMTLGSGHRLNEAVHELAAESGALLREDYEGTSLDALRQMVSVGMGLTLFPALYAASEFGKQEGVVLRKLDGHKLVRPIGLFWRQGSVRENHYRKLAGMCSQIAGQLSQPD
ncbi:MAG: LysR substrate-binding domain-containing protein [Rhizobiaceae bacterium]